MKIVNIVNIPNYPNYTIYGKDIETLKIYVSDYCQMIVKNIIMKIRVLI